VEERVKVLAVNREARRNYHIEQSYEAGIVLHGTEVKSMRLGNVNLKESYAFVRDMEVFISGMHVSPYEKGNIHNRDPLRERKLLLHKAEIARLMGYIKQKGMTLVPQRLYLKGRNVKLDLGVGKGKKLHDKRGDEAERDARRAIEARMKERSRDG